MWNYEKRLEYPIKIKQTNPTLAAMIISQYGGPYFNKVYCFPFYIGILSQYFYMRNNIKFFQYYVHLSHLLQCYQYR